jgi:hypothetical protein
MTPKNKPGKPSMVTKVTNPKYLGLRGTIVTPIERLQLGHVTHPALGSLRPWDSAWYWITEEHGRLVVFPDQDLRPLADPPEDAVDEMIRLNGKPVVTEFLNAVKQQLAERK